MGTNNKISGNDSNKERGENKTNNKPLLLIFGVPLVLIVFVLGWQSLKMPPNNTIADSIAVSNDSFDWSNEAYDTNAVTTERSSYNTQSNYSNNDFVGKYHVGESTRGHIYYCELNCLSINADGTARYVDSSYIAKLYNIEDNEYAGKSEFNTMEDFNSNKEKYREQYRYQLVGKRQITKIAYSWELRSDSQFGTFIMLTSSDGFHKFIKDGYMYKDFDSMKAKDEDKRWELTRIN